jgi:hypothetical protein
VRGGEGTVRGVAWIAAAVTVLTRVPFAARRLWDHDSVQFALGVERYDLAAHHPHPPGYPLYIAVLKGLAALGVSSQRGMVGLAILGAALGAGLIVPLTARLVREAAGRRGGSAWGGALGGDAEMEARVAHAAGLLAAALYVFNPLLWFYAELPLVYAVEGGMTVGLAYAALRMADGTLPFVCGCAAFAVAGGIRPSSLVLLLPLFLLGVWRAWWRGLGWGGLAAGAAVAVACGLSWLLPMLAAAGGYAAYQRIGREHFNALLPYTSILYGAGWGALAHNLTLMLKWFLQGLVPAAVTGAVLWIAGLLGGGLRVLAHRRGESGGPASRRPAGALAGGGAGLRLVGHSAPFLVTWALPAMLFFALFHITKAGYTLVYLPVLLVAAALVAAPMLVPLRGEGAGNLPAASRGESPQSREQPAGSEEYGGSDLPGVPAMAGRPPRAEARGMPQSGDGLPPQRDLSVRHLLSGSVGVAILLAAGTGAALFLFGADRRRDQPRALAVVRNEFNRGAIATFERDLDHLVATLRAYPPASTVLAAVELSGTGSGGPEAFLYPWQRHLQWYLPNYEVIHLVPEERLAFVTIGHRPFRRTGPNLLLPPGTRQIAIVLSGPTGDRFPLARWPMQRIGATFDLILVPFSENLQLAPFRFQASPAGILN